MATSRKNSRTGFAGAPAQRSPGGMSRHDTGCRRDLGARADPEVAGNAGLPSERGKIADNARSGDARLRDENRVAADDHVVANLDEIVDLRPLADHRVAVCAPVDRHARADFDVVLDDDPPDLRHLEMSARTEGEAEAVLTDMGAGVDDHPVADQRRDDRRRCSDSAVAADPHPGADHGIGTNDRAGADFRAAPDHRSRIDNHTGLQPCRRVDHRRGGDAALVEDGSRLDGARKQLRHHLGHGAIGLARHQRRTAGWRQIRMARTDESSRSARRLEKLKISGIVEEGQIAGARLVERRDVGDDAVRVGFTRQSRAAPAGDFGKGRRRAQRKEAKSWPRKGSAGCDDGRAMLWRARFKRNRQ